jgi:hypothetical protein
VAGRTVDAGVLGRVSGLSVFSGVFGSHVRHTNPRIVL